MQRINMRLAALALACASGSFVPEAHATSSVAPLKVEELTQRASDVLIGRVTDFSSRAEGNKIFTYVTVRVTGVWKDGGHAKQGTVTVRLLGGTSSGLRMRVIGAPCFGRDEEVVLFLTPNGDRALSVISLAEGKFRVVRDRSGDRVERDLSGIEFSQTNPVKAPERLKDLEELVRKNAK
jgi:hypothetical protein